MSRTNDLTNAIENYLKLQGVMAWRQNNLAAPNRRFNGRRGVPDISGILPGGKFIGIEVKTGKDKMSEYQISFRDESTAQGAVYIEAHTIDDVINYFEQPNGR